MENFVPLQTILPISNWPKLRHFHLSTFIVAQFDLMGVLAVLPSNIKTISLSFLSFFDNQGNHHSLLNEIRDTLKWHERDMASRPKLSIGIYPLRSRVGMGIWLEKEIDTFLYNGAENPFEISSPNQVDFGSGVEKDAFEDEHERPNVSIFKLEELGICKLE